MTDLEIPRNDLVVAYNQYQGERPTALCVCSAGVLRSPSIAYVLSGHPFNMNTRAAGIERSALFTVSAKHVLWADLIVCAEPYHADHILSLADKLTQNGHKVRAGVVTLNIPDTHTAYSPALLEAIEREAGRCIDL